MFWRRLLSSWLDVRLGPDTLVPPCNSAERASGRTICRCFVLFKTGLGTYIRTTFRFCLNFVQDNFFRACPGPSSEGGCSPCLTPGFTPMATVQMRSRPTTVSASPPSSVSSASTRKPCVCGSGVTGFRRRSATPRASASTRPIRCSGCAWSSACWTPATGPAGSSQPRCRSWRHCCSRWRASAPACLCPTRPPRSPAAPRCCRPTTSKACAASWRRRCCAEAWRAASPRCLRH
mmetsp:Transcript_5539/g.13432  ORF Transcript_5539/g.13432 Transcript_5539/m.13432 type:complete len:234 (-) Transcript_5539:269-970(-)